MSLDFDLQWSAAGSHAEGEPHAPGFSLDLACRLNAPVTGLFGPSGAGKSTLLSLISGLQRPHAGRISLDDQPLFDAARRIELPTHQRRIALLFQDGRLFPHMNAAANLRYGYRPREAPHALRFDDVVQLLALAPLLDRSTPTLSGGERQRVALGRALLSHPRFLLLDEPLASLDRAMKQQLLPFLRRVAEQSHVPMLYVSHDVGEILQLTQEVLVLDAGRRLGQGPLHEVIRDAHIFTLATRLGLENVLRARIVEHLPESGLTRLRLIANQADREGVIILGPLLSRPAGAEVTLAIRPEDVALARQRVEGISIQNQIPGTVAQITPVAGRGLLEVDIGEQLLTEVSLRSIGSLQLVPGSPVHCLFKAHAVRYLDVL